MNIGHLPRTLLLAFCCAVGCAPTARADFCEKADAPVLKAICADDSARTGYGELMAAFDEALGRLSPEGQAILTASESRWEARFSGACIDHLEVTRAHNEDWDDHPLQHCLSTFIDGRKSFLRDQGRKEGNFILQEIDDARDLYCDVGGSKNLLSITRSTVRIDAPRNDVIDKWNGQRMQEFSKSGDAADDACESDGTYEDTTGIRYADGDFIELASDYYHLETGMPHAQSRSDVQFELVAGSREIEASDLFEKGSGWQAYIAKRMYADYLSEVSQSGVSPRYTEPDFEKFAEETVRWEITAKTLEYVFGSYDLGGYADSNFATTFTWKELRPYLRGDLPFHPDFN